MAKNALAFACLALVVTGAAAGRALLQAPPPPVSGQQLTAALSRINNAAQVPDTSAAIAQTPNYEFKVSQVQGPAATIVQASYTLTSPGDSPDKQAEYAALRAYGNQSGAQGLPYIGQMLYYAYQSVTSVIFGP